MIESSFVRWNRQDARENSHEKPSAAHGRNQFVFKIDDISGRPLRVIVPIQDGHHAGNQPRSGDIV
jgi:hypothetical protein